MGVDILAIRPHFGPAILFLLGAVIGYCYLVRWLRGRTGAWLLWLLPVVAAIVLAAVLGATLAGTTPDVLLPAIASAIFLLPSFGFSTWFLVRRPAAVGSAMPASTLVGAIIGWFGVQGLVVLCLMWLVTRGDL